MYIPAQGGGGFTKEPGQNGAGGPKCVSYAGSVNSDIEDGKIKKDAPPAQLYDLVADVHQTTNVYRDYPEVVQELEAVLNTHRSAGATKKRWTRREFPSDYGRDKR